jgi:hypothetical protein
MPKRPPLLPPVPITPPLPPVAAVAHPVGNSTMAATPVAAKTVLRVFFPIRPFMIISNSWQVLGVVATSTCPIATVQHLQTCGNEYLSYSAHRRRGTKFALSALGVYCRARASSRECRSSQYPQRGLIQTDPPLWVGSYYRRSLLQTREDRHSASFKASQQASFHSSARLHQRPGTPVCGQRVVRPPLRRRLAAGSAGAGRRHVLGKLRRDL